MTNFDFLTKDPQFSAFSQVAINAEKVFSLDFESSAVNCRRAMEFAVKWLYSVDSSLILPYNESLSSLLATNEFRKFIDKDMLTRLKFIQKTGNNAVHNAQAVTREQAFTSLLNLFIFLDFIAVCYSKNYEKSSFKPTLLEKQTAQEHIQNNNELELEKLIQENQALKEELTKRREVQEKEYTPVPLDLSEFQTRKIYIDTMLMEMGWVLGKNWVNEVRVSGMPNSADEGFVDYVLYDDSHKPLAIIEAKRTSVNKEKGRQQAKLYADCLEKEHDVRPVIFLSNGFEHSIIDEQYPERDVANIYSKRDLEKLFNLRKFKIPLKDISLNTDIAGRYYQEAAVKSICHAFEMNRRKALLVMATGSGKTRTIISLCDVLLRQGHIKNILFLADRTSLVRQAKKHFTLYLPYLSNTNLCDDKNNYNAHCVLSTYQSMMSAIDDVYTNDIQDENGKLFTSGHFDLVICDEAHRSIYNKYKDIFTYFDAPLVGLTATPKDEVDKNTYEIFHLENGNPTYAYELSQAVTDGYLVPYQSIETKLKFLHEGIAYDELSDEDKDLYEETFQDEEGHLPERFSSSALNSFIFNENTISQVLHILMTQGIHVDYGNKIGKTIIFAKNHKHAEKILEVFNKEYPHFVNYAAVIDNYLKYAQSAIDEFSDAQKMPQIAISVDMLDTGVDVPEVLNLVFFKKVMSKAKFWQMIGRGTRLCEKLLDGQDKTQFYIFDFCGNFEFFRMSNGMESKAIMSLQGALFNLKASIAHKLQDIDYQTEELIKFRTNIVQYLHEKVQELNKNNFAVKQHLRAVEKYSKVEHFQVLCDIDIVEIKEHICPLILPDSDEITALRFDALMHGIELAYLVGKNFSKAKSDLYKRVKGVASVANIPEIQAQAEFLQTLLNSSYIEDAGINEFEHIREKLRDLIKYIPKTGQLYNTNFTDEILDQVWNDPEFDNSSLKNYKEKAEFYIKENQDNPVIKKLKTNIPLTKEDVEELRTILWQELGTKNDYEECYGDKPLGQFVREIVGLDMNAAKNAFSAYLNNTNLDSRQIYFLNQIVEYIVKNGMMTDLSVLQSVPFIDKGSIGEVFDDMHLWSGIRGMIESINANVEA